MCVLVVLLWKTKTVYLHLGQLFAAFVPFFWNYVGALTVVRNFGYVFCQMWYRLTAVNLQRQQATWWAHSPASARWTPRNPHEAVKERFQMYPGTNSWSTNGYNHDWGGLVLTWNGLQAVAMAEVKEGNKSNWLALLWEGNCLCHWRQKERVAQVLPPH